MLFSHFNFPELRTFSFNLTTSWTFMKSTMADVAGYIQDRKWSRLESGQLIIKVTVEDMGVDMLVVDDEDNNDVNMANEKAVWVSLLSASFHVPDSYHDF
jgi:hypothetical protein